MTTEDFVKIATPLAWPTVTLVIFLLVFEPVHALLKRLSETLTFKSLKVKALGVEAELTPEYAESVLQELLADITASSNQLTPEEITLFDQILASDGQKTVEDLIPGFRRETPPHERLRNLRDQKLILPTTRGSWKGEKIPIVTPYGHLVAKLRTSSADKVRSFRKSAV